MLSRSGTAAGERLALFLTGQGITVEEARATAPSLEDIFIARIRAADQAARGEATR